ncbi:hypothetical protein QMG61_02815 [Cryobacterium sp. PH31-AA6]|uniref:hypothetical protein n=1 Tax=Cryobacterium sp. PH31-AA6 TaxID=3046205 RepID=UPI0024BB628F|nr:hypothetical protein [Cryobacterium sp. PH31-AA6]MDJ0322695.1 hypothetical protein [Cryobacterium sp. PH31-AA6]
MTGLPTGADATLAPVRDSLRAAALATVAEIGHDARERGQALLAAAGREADGIRAAAAAAGEDAARSEATMRSARVRRQAHETVLTQRNALRLELQEKVRVSATALRTDPRYPDLLAGLIERAHALLGPDATVTENEDGGVTAEAGSRRLDLSLPTLAADTLAQMSPEVADLWRR